MQQSRFSMLKLADTFSLLNASLGFLAILMILWGEQREAFSLIFLALLTDGLDGIIARHFGEGKLGEYLEAMADMLSFCIAPLLFLLWFGVKIYSADPAIIVIAVISSFIFLVCNAIRLAAFHLLKDPYYFIGIPVSISTIVILSLVVLGIDIYLLLIVMILIAFLLISYIRFVRPPIWMNVIAASLVILSLFLYTMFNGFGLFLLIFGVISYTILSLFFINKPVK